MKKVQLAEGISAVLPPGWEYSAESPDGISTFSIQMTNGSCHAELEILNNRQIPSHEFVLSHRFDLMQSLISLNLKLDPPNKKFPLELLGSKDSIQGKVFHILIPTNPVAHLSAITATDSDLVEVRAIADSIKIDDRAKVEGDEEILPMKLSKEWQELNSN